MKTIFGVLIFISFPAFAGEISLTIDGVYNVAKSTVLDVCGKAVSKTGKWPIVVSVTHESSIYTTMTSKDNRYCVLITRQNWKGEVSAIANTIDGSETSSSISFLEDKGE